MPESKGASTPRMPPLRNSGTVVGHWRANYHQTWSLNTWPNRTKVWWQRSRVPLNMIGVSIGLGLQFEQGWFSLMFQIRSVFDFMLLIFTLPSHRNGLAAGSTQEGTHQAVGPRSSTHTSHIPLPSIPSSIIATPTCLADQLCDQVEPEEDC